MVPFPPGRAEPRKLPSLGCAQAHPPEAGRVWEQQCRLLGGTHERHPLGVGDLHGDGRHPTRWHGARRRPFPTACPLGRGDGRGGQGEKGRGGGGGLGGWGAEGG